jgi:hypothetical protein
MRQGDEIIEIGGAKVADLSAQALRDALGPVAAPGLALQVQHEGATTEAMRLGEGPIYPLVREYGPID